MGKFISCLILICAASPVLAQDWNLRKADILLDRAGAEALTAGNTLTFIGDGEARYSVGGSYSYTFEDDSDTVFGLFRIEPDGRICVDFRDGYRRCDFYVVNDSVLLMLTEKGGRFPVRVHLGLRP